VFGLKHFFADLMADQAGGLRDILRGFPADVILTDSMFCGTLPLLLGPRHARPAILGIGISALALTSADTACFGTAQPPPTTAMARARNAMATKFMQQSMLGGVQKYFNETLARLGCAPLPMFLLDALGCLPDLYLQLTSQAFEYPRSDLPPTIRFVGPLLAPPAADFTPPGWWGDLDGSRPVVLVTQGTLANEDLAQLVGPTLTGLAGEDVIAVATTGGPPVEAIPAALPQNARAAVFLPYDRLLPKVDVLVTNGGYGSVNYALSLGVPLVVAGDSEEKPEIAARVAWTGAGINLGTGQPTPQQIRDAVRQVLTDPRYRQRARALQADFARHDARSEVAAIVEQLAADRSATGRHGGVLAGAH
jgi:UDP:flavonoid glycosyltransferase YjiC (YdhE family)